MYTKVNRFLKLSFNNITNDKFKIIPVSDTMRLFEEKVLFHKPNKTNNDFEVYYPSAIIGGSPAPFPKLEPDSELFFIVKKNGDPRRGKINLLQSPNSDINNMDLIDIRRNQTSFNYTISNGSTQVSLIIKTLFGTEIHREILNVQTEGTNSKAIYSFDFSSYPFGIYTSELENNASSKSTFVIDKTGELIGKFALLRILYDGINLEYSLPNNLDFQIN